MLLCLWFWLAAQTLTSQALEYRGLNRQNRVGDSLQSNRTMRGCCFEFSRPLYGLSWKEVATESGLQFIEELRRAAKAVVVDQAEDQPEATIEEVRV